MRKVQFAAVFWTLALAIPFTALAISGAAYLTDHLSSVATSIASLGHSTTAGSRTWLLEFAARWPEVAGMIIGQIVLLAIFFFARQATPINDNNQIIKKK